MPVENITQLNITDTISGRAWAEVSKSRLWNILSTSLDEGISGAVPATREMYAVVRGEIGSDLTQAEVWGPHHEITQEGNLVLNRGGLIAAVAALSGARSEPDLTDAQFATARDHLRRHYDQVEELELPEVLGGEGAGEGELALGPAVGELSVDVAMDQVPLTDTDRQAAEKLMEGDEQPCWVAVEIIEGQGSHGNYQPSALQAVVEQVNEDAPMGFLGHQRQEDIPFEFPEPTTHWFAAEMDEKDGREVARIYGLIDQAYQNLRRWVRAGRIKEVSIYGRPGYQPGTKDVVDYDLYSIDWAPRGRAGMETELLWASEMRDSPNGEKGELDGSYDELIVALRDKVHGQFADENTDAFVERAYPGYSIVEVREEGEAASLYRVEYTVEGDEIRLGEAVPVEERRVYEPKTETGGSAGEMEWTEMLAAIRAAMAKGELETEQVLAELGITGEQALKTLGDDRLKKLRGAAELGRKLKDALKLDNDTEVEEAVNQAGEMRQVWDSLELENRADVDQPATFVGELVKAYEKANKGELSETIDEVVKEKVTGEHAQGLIKRLLHVEEGSDKEQIAGEVDNLLADEEVKGMLSRLHTDTPPPKGGSGGEQTGFKSGRTKKVRV